MNARKKRDKKDRTIFGENSSKIFFFGKIKAVEECLILINSVFWFSMVVGALLLLPGIIDILFFSSDIHSLIAFVEGILLIILALIILKKRSRIASIIFLVISIIGFINVITSPLGMYRGGTNFLITIFQIIIAIHSVRATFAYNILKNGKKK